MITTAPHKILNNIYTCTYISNIIFYQNEEISYRQSVKGVFRGLHDRMVVGFTSTYAISAYQVTLKL
jgi:hypothetical protein